MPPLAVVGFGLSTRDWPIFLGASWLFMTNLLAIALTIAIVARCYGFGSQNSPRQSLWQLGVLASTFLLLSIPLGITLRRSEAHTSELQSLMRISYAAFC